MSIATLTDLASETNQLLVTSAVSSSKRTLAYVQSVWNVVLAPITSTDVESGFGEMFARSNKVADLTIAEIEAAAKLAMDVSGKLVSQTEKMRDASVAVARESAQRSADSVNELVETAKARFN